MAGASSDALDVVDVRAGRLPLPVGGQLGLLLLLVRSVGFPAVFAGVLLWALLRVLPEQTQAIVGAVRDGAAQHAAALREVEKIQRELLASVARLLERSGR